MIPFTPKWSCLPIQSKGSCHRPTEPQTVCALPASEFDFRILFRNLQPAKLSSHPGTAPEHFSFTFLFTSLLRPPLIPLCLHHGSIFNSHPSGHWWFWQGIHCLPFHPGLFSFLVTLGFMWTIHPTPWPLNFLNISFQRLFLPFCFRYPPVLITWGILTCICVTGTETRLINAITSLTGLMPMTLDGLASVYFSSFIFLAHTMFHKHQHFLIWCLCSGYHSLAPTSNYLYYSPVESLIPESLPFLFPPNLHHSEHTMYLSPIIPWHLTKLFQSDPNRKMGPILNI